MLAWLKGLLFPAKEEEVVLTIDNAPLEDFQKATAVKAMKILNYEPRQEDLKKQDLLVFLYAVGMNPTEDLVDSKIRELNLHKVDSLTIGQFAHIWASMLKDLTDEEEILKRAFFFFDKDGNGEISVQELRTTMHELGDLLTEDEIVSFMSVMDVNNDGVIGFQEFLLTLKTQTPDLAASAASPSAQPAVATAAALSPSAQAQPVSEHWRHSSGGQQEASSSQAQPSRQGSQQLRTQQHAEQIGSLPGQPPRLSLAGSNLDGPGLGPGSQQQLQQERSGLTPRHATQNLRASPQLDVCADDSQDRGYSMLNPQPSSKRVVEPG